MSIPPLLPAVLNVVRIPQAARDLVLLIVDLAPELRDAVAALVRAFKSGDEAEARRAYEAARRVAFAGRQR